MKILLITPRLPHASIAYGGGIFNRRLLEYLSQHHQVDVISFFFEGEQAIVPEVASLCQNLFTVEDRQDRSLIEKVAKRVLAPNHHWPFAPYNYSIELARLVQQIVMQEKYDIVQAEYTWMGQYIANLDHPATVLDEVDLQVLTYQQRYQKTLSILGRIFSYFEWKRMMRYEQKLSSRVKAVLVRTSYDQTYLQTLNPKARVRVVSHGVSSLNLNLIRKETDHLRLIFMGDFSHPPNRDAITYFVQEIFPRVRASLTEVKLQVLGRNAPQYLNNIEGVQVLGFVPSVTPYLQKAAIFISPIRWGSGIKTKNLDAMSLGLPVVTTTCGAAGIEAVDGESIMIADQADVFAAKVIRLLNDAELRQRIGLAGRQVIREKYTWDAIFRDLERVYKELNCN